MSCSLSVMQGLYFVVIEDDIGHNTVKQYKVILVIVIL